METTHDVISAALHSELGDGHDVDALADHILDRLDEADMIVVRRAALSKD